MNPEPEHLDINETIRYERKLARERAAAEQAAAEQAQAQVNSRNSSAHSSPQLDAVLPVRSREATPRVSPQGSPYQSPVGSPRRSPSDEPLPSIEEIIGGRARSGSQGNDGASPLGRLAAQNRSRQDPRPSPAPSGAASSVLYDSRASSVFSAVPQQSVHWGAPGPSGLRNEVSAKVSRAGSTSSKASEVSLPPPYTNPGDNTGVLIPAGDANAVILALTGQKSSFVTDRRPDAKVPTVS